VLGWHQLQARHVADNDSCNAITLVLWPNVESFRLGAYEYLPDVTASVTRCEQLARDCGVLLLLVVATSPAGMALMPTIGTLYTSSPKAKHN
jgi:hypothetical protein